MSAGVERTPDDTDDVQSILVTEMEDGDVVFFDEDNPDGFIRIDPENVFDLSKVPMR